MNKSDSEIILDDIAKGLIRWIPFRDGGRAALVYIDRNKISPYHEILNKAGMTTEIVEITSFSVSEAYDYIICIEDIERVLDVEQLLRQLHEGLKEDGYLILGMNNRFGIRFLCGDRDIYTYGRFDGIGNYVRAKSDNGRCYSDRQIKKMLSRVGFSYYTFYSVMPTLQRPTMILSENSIPNEAIGNRIFPEYDFPSGVFLNEQELYDDFVAEGLFHKFANAYLVIAGNNKCDIGISSITLSTDRNQEDSMMTVAYDNCFVEKKPIYRDGISHLVDLDKNLKQLEQRGIRVVKGNLTEDGYRMPYIDAPTGQQFLEDLLVSNLDVFLHYMDEFSQQILKSSDKVGYDDTLGDIYDTVYPDMVPLNSFFVNGEFVFFDQEFVEKNYPINVVLVRMIDSFYYGKPHLNNYYIGGLLYERYGIKKGYKELDKMQIAFLDKHIQNDVLSENHERHRPLSTDIVKSWIAMNEIGDYVCDLRKFLELIVLGKKMIIFGTGKYADDYMSRYAKRCPPIAVVDNDDMKWGKLWRGMTIQSPEILDNYRDEDCTILICIKNYQEIKKQLSKMWIFQYLPYLPEYSHNTDGVI